MQSLWEFHISNCAEKLNALVSRSKLDRHISKFQFVNKLNIREILRGSINSDYKFCLPIFFSDLDRLY